MIDLVSNNLEGIRLALAAGSNLGSGYPDLPDRVSPGTLSVVNMTS